MENFVPSVETEKITSRAVYDEEEENWKLLPYQAPSARYLHYIRNSGSTNVHYVCALYAAMV